MGFPKTQFIKIEANADKDWLTLWFNQPERRNPLTAGATAELMTIFERLQKDRSVRGVTLRGRGGIFCAGGDLSAFKEDLQAQDSAAEIMTLSRNMAKILDGFNSLPQVTLAYVEGAAVAGGFGLMCCADVVICAADTKFSMSETMIGLSPAQIAPYVIQRLGYAPARRLMLTAERFSGKDAQLMGLADFSGEDTATLDVYEQKIRGLVLRCAPGAVADTKSLLVSLPHLSRGAAIEAAAENFTHRLLSAEAKDGISSFFEKRKPSWAK
jgi:isohexenylglutaconyl-CoA hydratase